MGASTDCGVSFTSWCAGRGGFLLLPFPLCGRAPVSHTEKAEAWQRKFELEFVRHCQELPIWDLYTDVKQHACVKIRLQVMLV